MGWLSKMLGSGNLTAEKGDYWPEDCPYLLKQVSGGEVYRGCQNLTVLSYGSAIIKPGQLNDRLGKLFSGICSSCDVPEIIENNPCKELSLGVEVPDSVAGMAGKQGSVKINAACSAKGTKISSPVSCKDGCDSFADPNDSNEIFKEYKTPALGKFKNQQQFAEWIAEKLDEQGHNASINVNSREEWPCTLSVEIDNMELAIIPGIDDETGEPNAWIWSIGIGKVRSEYFSSDEVSSAVASVNNQGVVSIASKYLDDPSVLESLMFCEVKYLEGTNIGLNGTAKWSDSIEEAITNFRAPGHLVYGIIMELRRFFPDA